MESVHALFDGVALYYEAEHQLTIIANYQEVEIISAKDSRTVLLLAKYLPPCPKDATREDYVEEHEKYHHELYESLSKICHVIPSRNLSDIERYRDEIDFVFPVFNNAGFVGAESFPAAQCERFNIPYLGARPAIRGVAEDKHLGKILATYADVKTPAWVAINTTYPLSKELLDGIEPPYFVKPRYGRNSEGITANSVQQSPEGAIERARENKEEVDYLIEHRAPGIYCTVPAWMKAGKVEVLPPILQRCVDGSPITSDLKAHRREGLVREVSSSDELNALSTEAVMRIYELMLPLDFARFDFIYDEDNKELNFLEINVCCSLSQRSTFYMAAKYMYGYTYDEFVACILENSIKRQSAELQK